MLTIGQLASYAGVTVAAVRHYHKIGLLPEPSRDNSGYRSYDAAAIVRLIRIRVLASAGVPLSQVDALLAADPEAFAIGVQWIDRILRAEAQRIQATRRQLGQLAAGDHLALPASVVGYLDRLRQLGLDERYLERERDAWILVAAQIPDRIDDVMAAKHRDLDDPDIIRLYEIFGQAFTMTAEDPRIVEAADILDRVLTRASEGPATDPDEFDTTLLDLMDATMADSAPAATRLLELLRKRGWKGWTRFERSPNTP